MTHFLSHFLPILSQPIGLTEITNINTIHSLQYQTDEPFSIVFLAEIYYNKVYWHTLQGPDEAFQEYAFHILLWCDDTVM